MGEKEYKKSKLQMQGFSYILAINGFLQKFGWGSKKIDEHKDDFIQMKNELNSVKSYPEKYTEYFTQYGFVVYSSMNFSIMKKSVDLYEEKKMEESIKVIREYYSPDEIEERFSLIKNSGIEHNRVRFIRNALEDYKNERYYAVTPILLMMIDGIISDIGQHGIHSQKSELSAWDMFEVEDKGLQLIKDIFSKSRKKTTDEKISFPYRNGILHGRDLGYDTEKIAILSWVYLFAIISFIENKRTENVRKEKYIKDNEKVSFRELFVDIKKIEATKKNISEWEARIISDKYIESINKECINDDQPECMVIKYLNYLKKSNYGNMVKNEYRTDIITEKNYGIFAKRVRKKFTDIKLEKFRIISIEDTAPAITIVNVELDVLYYEERQKKNIEIRCIIKAEGETAIHGDKDGIWKIIPLCI